jgi:hypothetical protein
VTARPPRPARLAVVAALVAVVVVITSAPFFLATTFIGDDHLFLAYARYAPHPLVAFFRDQHGGEFYRPIPMMLWWMLGRLAAPATWPFALAALSLHALVAVEVALLFLAMGGERRAAWMAAAFFFLAPATREAAFWYSASTDLLASAALLGSLIMLLRGRPRSSVALAVAAYLCKESALVLPLLGGLVLLARDGTAARARWRARLAAVIPHVLLGAATFAVRWRILGGWGGAGDQRAPVVGKLVQMASGLAHAVTGTEVVPEALAWGCGVAFLSLALLASLRARRAGERLAWLPFLFTGVALLPLLAADWLVGARYFYLPAVGLAWLAGQGLRRAGPAARAVVLLALVGLGSAQALARHRDVASYEARVGAARRAVVAGAGEGHRVFHVVSGIKDLDLAVKEAPALRAVAAEVLVLADVPASFAVIPDALHARAAFLLAAPPLPPSGAYRFGARAVVGLARRGDDPTLDEVVSHFPDIRFIRLRPSPGGRIIARDVTEEVRSNAD